MIILQILDLLAHKSFVVFVASIPDFLMRLGDEATIGLLASVMSSVSCNT